MRVADAWHDACLLNLSSRGAMAQAARAPARGCYLELRCGPYVIIGRVAWSKGHRFGLRTQDRLPVEQLVGGAAAAANEGGPALAAPGTERRRMPRDHAWGAEQSRWRGRALEFGCVLLLAASMGLAAFGSMEQVLAHPLASARTALDAANVR